MLQASSRYASPFQTPEYRDFLLTQDGHEALVVWVGGADSETHGCASLRVLALLVIDLQSNGFRRLTSRAIVQGGPVISPDCPQEAVALLMREAIDISRRHNAVYFEIRPYFDYSHYSGAFSSVGLQYIDYCDCQADTSSLEAIDRNIQPRKLTQIRSALRHGIDFIDQPTDVQITEFYALLRRRHWQRTRRPLPSLQYFIDLSHTSFGAVLLAYHDGALISGCVAIHCRDAQPCVSPSTNQYTFYYYVAGEDDLYRHLAPSSVITYHFLQYACKKGSQYASMMGAGRLSIPFGVRDFKVKMGAKVIPTGRYLFKINPLIYNLASFALNLLHRSDT